MRDLINFFFSFDKLMKEKLVIVFYWLALIVALIAFVSTAFETVRLGPLSDVLDFVNFFAGMLLVLVGLRLLCEIAVAIFRINNNLSPDGGKSETADIDPMAEARKAAEAAAIRAREVAKATGEKTKSTFSDVKDSVEDAADTVTAKAKSATQATKSRTEDIMGKGSVHDPADDPTPVKILEPKATTKTRAKRKTAAKPVARKTSAKKPATTKPATTKPATKKTAAKKAPAKSKAAKPKTTGAKRGPKKGQKVKRDAQGRLLKKDGTLRAKPGPKKS
ncbi:DUF4282 domain-containing protein [Litorimonas sp. RW-G-Af-16]|uniref:DUF4282 domain-containing protein n=1 Tax=Litorimonas sp. RW-G-Af-16 TaxID=3241168 RepID=UPI00390CA51B